MSLMSTGRFLKPSGVVQWKALWTCDELLFVAGNENFMVTEEVELPSQAPTPPAYMEGESVPAVSTLRACDTQLSILIPFNRRQ